MRRIVFIHQNFPGQFIHLVRHFLAQSDVMQFGIGCAKNIRTPSHGNLQVLTYPEPAPANEQTHHYVRFFENSVRYGQSALRQLQAIIKEHGMPDLIIAHPSWGEAMFLREVCPQVPIVLYNEYFDATPNPVLAFDPEFTAGFDEYLRARARTATQLISQQQATACIAPTRWQNSLFPDFVQARTQVIHDGVDTELIQPPLQASAVTIQTTEGKTITLAPDSCVVTYMTRNLEPHRGFHRFMRALPQLQRACPQAQFVIVGNDEVSYSKLPANFAHWRAALCAELGEQIDLTRVHFCARLPFATYLELLYLSRAHVYLTYPSVLSWSVLEAMSAAALVVASRTAPVQEVITDGVNGLLFDFFDTEALVQQVAHALAQPAAMQALRQAARATVKQRYDLKTVRLPAMLDLLTQVGRAN